MKTSIRSNHSAQRGSVLLIAMILMVCIGVAVASHLSLSRTNMVISNRAFYNNAAMNLAENGLEEGMYSMNKKVADPTYDWSGWTINGNDATRKLTGYTFDQGATGETYVIVYNYLGISTPKIVARSVIRLGASNTPPIEKWVEVQLSKTSRYSYGLLAKEGILFKGNNASVDSWNSQKNDDGTPRVPAVGYSAAVKHDLGPVASISVAVDAVLVKNADVWGYVKTGGSVDPTVGANGVIGPFGTATGTVDPSRTSTDFSMPIEPQPTIASGTSVPAIVQADLPKTLGTTGTTTILRLPSISSSGPSSKVLTIAGDVTLVLTGAATSDVISLGGSASINIPAGSSLKIYAEGSIDIAGNGIANTNSQPSSFTIINTNTSTTTTPTVKIAGNGDLKAVVDAPNANVTINGNGNVMGSVIGKNIELTGNAAFHYDESLADDTVGNPFRVSKWKELTTISNRNDYRTDLTF